MKKPSIIKYHPSINQDRSLASQRSPQLVYDNSMMAAGANALRTNQNTQRGAPRRDQYHDSITSLATRRAILKEQEAVTPQFARDNGYVGGLQKKRTISTQMANRQNAQVSRSKVKNIKFQENTDNFQEYLNHLRSQETSLLLGDTLNTGDTQKSLESTESLNSASMVPQDKKQYQQRFLNQNISLFKTNAKVNGRGSPGAADLQMPGQLHIPKSKIKLSKSKPCFNKEMLAKNQSYSSQDALTTGKRSSREQAQVGSPGLPHFQIKGTKRKISEYEKTYMKKMNKQSQRVHQNPIGVNHFQPRSTAIGFPRANGKSRSMSQTCLTDQSLKKPGSTAADYIDPYANMKAHIYETKLPSIDFLEAHSPTKKIQHKNSMPMLSKQTLKKNHMINKNAKNSFTDGFGSFRHSASYEQRPYESGNYNGSMSKRKTFQKHDAESYDEISAPISIQMNNVPSKQYKTQQRYYTSKKAQGTARENFKDVSNDGTSKVTGLNDLQVIASKRDKIPQSSIGLITESSIAQYQKRRKSPDGGKGSDRYRISGAQPSFGGRHSMESFNQQDGHQRVQVKVGGQDKLIMKEHEIIQNQRQMESEFKAIARSKSQSVAQQNTRAIDLLKVLNQSIEQGRKERNIKDGVLSTQEREQKEKEELEAQKAARNSISQSLAKNMSKPTQELAISLKKAMEFKLEVHEKQGKVGNTISDNIKTMIMQRNSSYRQQRKKIEDQLKAFMNENARCPIPLSMTNLREEKLQTLLEHREQEAKASARAREGGKTHRAQSLLDLREKAKNPCFEAQDEYVKLNRFYRKANQEMENISPRKTDSPSNCNLSFFKSQLRLQNSSDDLMPYAKKLDDSKVLKQKAMNTKLIRESAMASKYDNMDYVNHNIDSADAKKVFDVFLTDQDNVMDDEEVQKANKETFVQFAKKVFNQNIMNKLTIQTQALYPQKSNQENCFIQNVLGQNHNKYNMLSLSGIGFKIDNTAHINIITEYFHVNNICSLNLSQNALSTGSIMVLCNQLLVRSSAITSLNLSQTTMDPPSIQLLCQTLINHNQSLISLDLANGGAAKAPGKSQAQGGQGSQGSSGLGHLDNRIGQLGAKYISFLVAQSAYIQYVNLQSNYVGTQGFKDIMQALLFERPCLSPNLNDFQSIVLKNNDIGPFEIHHMARLMEGALRDLKMQRNAPVQIGIQMDWRNIGKQNEENEAGQTARENEQSQDHPRTSQKSENPRNQESATTPRTRDAPKVINSVDDLNNDENEMNLLVELDISQNPKIMGCNIGKFVSCLSQYTQVQTLNLSNCSLFNLPESQLVSRLLTQKKNVRKITLDKKSGKYEIDDDDAEYGQQAVSDAAKLFYELAYNKYLKSLNLSNNRFLMHDESLNQVFGYSWEWVCRSIQNFAASNTTISTLNLSHCHLGDEGAASLFQGLAANNKTRLKTLILKGNVLQDAAIMDHLLPLLGKGRRNAKVNHAQHQHDGAECKMELFALGVKPQADKCILEHLDLSKNQISDFTGDKMAQFLKKNTILKHLNLSDNLLKDDSGQRFELMLDTNKTLIYLNLDLNSIRQISIEKIQQKINHNKTLVNNRTIHETQDSIKALKGRNTEHYFNIVMAKIAECKIRREAENAELAKQIEVDREEKLIWAKQTKQEYENCVNIMKNCIAKKMIFGLCRAREDNHLMNLQKAEQHLKSRIKQCHQDMHDNKRDIIIKKNQRQTFKQTTKATFGRLRAEIERQRYKQEKAVRNYLEALKEQKSLYQLEMKNDQARESEQVINEVEAMWNADDKGYKMHQDKQAQAEYRRKETQKNSGSGKVSARKGRDGR